MKVDVVKAAGFRVSASAIDHLRCHIDSDRATLGSDFWRSEEHIEPAATSEIDDHLAGFQMSVGGWVATRQTHVCFSRDRCELVGGVSKSRRNFPNTDVLARQTAGCDRAIPIA